MKINNTVTECAKKKEEKQIIICMIEKFIRISFSILTMNNNNWPSGFVQQLHLTG